MKAIWTILLKEVRDNLRDRRSLFFALLYGPLLLPALMIGPLVFNVNQYSIDAEQSQSLSVVGQERAPNLMAYLAEHRIRAQPFEGELTDLDETHTNTLVLEVPEQYGQAMRDGEPAPLVIHYHSGESDLASQRRRLRQRLDQYHSQLRSQRLLVRGLDETVFEPLAISERDLALKSSREPFVGLLLPFMLLFSMMMGGFYLAVDTTAGERERLSLEPLLALPVPRWQLVAGKYGAIVIFVLLALALPLVTASVLFGMLDDVGFSERFDFSALNLARIGLLHLPLGLLLSALVLVIGAYARSTKEAQTQLGLAMMVPMLPFFLLQFLDLPRTAATLATPLMGQYQLAEQWVAGQATGWQAALGVSATTLVLVVALLAVAVRRYGDESMLR